MESALSKYAAGEYDLKSGAPHALDEAWALYVGSMETGDVSSGYGPYIAAEKAAKKLGTYGYEMGTGGRSRVSVELLYQFTAMQRYLQTAGNDQVLADIAKCIRSQFKVPLVQQCLAYSHAASTEEITLPADLPKIKAESWAFCSAALPFLHEADATSAEAVKNTTTISNVSRPDWQVVKEAFSTKNLNKMGIMCEDVGLLGAGGYNADVYGFAPPYADDELKRCKDDPDLISANLYADSSKCAFVKMPRCSTSGVTC